jgi:hypothetical protein
MTEQPRGEWDDDPEGPPSPEEEAEARALAEALEARDAPAPHPARDLAEALRAAASPRPLDPARHDQLLARALAAPAGQLIVVPARRWQRSAIVATALVAAACALLVLGKTRPPAPPALVASRSTQELFDEPFPRSGGSSARVDRIAAARGRELRHNRFASWGVR